MLQKFLRLHSQQSDKTCIQSSPAGSQSSTWTTISWQQPRQICSNVSRLYQCVARKIRSSTPPSPSGLGPRETIGRASMLGRRVQISQGGPRTCSPTASCLRVFILAKSVAAQHSTCSAPRMLTSLQHLFVKCGIRPAKQLAGNESDLIFILNTDDSRLAHHGQGIPPRHRPIFLGWWNKFKHFLQ